MEYADLVLGTIVAGYSLVISVLVSLGAGLGTAIGIGSLVSIAVIFDALFGNPPL